MEALFFQPDPSGDPVAALMSDLADRLGVEASGLTLRARDGERVLFGCSGLKQTITPDGASLTFASSAEVFRKWTFAVQWGLAHDWTWDGLADGVIHVETVPGGSGAGDEVGTIPVPRIASPESISVTPDRTRTRLVFLHAIDPTVVDIHDGFTARDPYRFSANLAVEGGATVVARSDADGVRLPVAVIPAGVPQLASAGYALSEYVAATDYSSTGSRHRQLWLEFASPPEPGDRLFARLLTYTPRSVALH